MIPLKTVFLIILMSCMTIAVLMYTYLSTTTEDETRPSSSPSLPFSQNFHPKQSHDDKHISRHKNLDASNEIIQDSLDRRQNQVIRDTDYDHVKTYRKNKKSKKSKKKQSISNDAGKYDVESHESKDLGMIHSEAERKQRDEGMKKQAFNVLISDRIGNHRSIPDTRFPLCKNQSYLPNLPSVSIIVCFYNEALSTLLRTVHSVLDRTSDRLIKEIILVDDYSDEKEIKFHLLKYVMEQLPHKVKLIRTPERSGLIRARMFGVGHAVGQVLVFLDSHVEVNINWLPPLLERIVNNRTRVVCPVIDIINANTFEYTASPIVRGGFNWGLHFKWDSVPSHLLQEKSDFIKAIPTPTMAGGLYAMDREFFHKLGGYDRGMDIWGGENIEMSFRVWMCGGSIEIVQCSRVGHVFRQRRPYGSPDGLDTMTRNSKRLAEVWMDEYKKYFYETRPDAVNMSYGDVSERRELRKSLNCQSFDWYAKEVYVGLKPPDPRQDSKKKRIKMKNSQNIVKSGRKAYKVLGRYQVQLHETDFCLESENEVTAKGSRIMLSPCAAVKRQLWSETELKELKLADVLCLDTDSQHPMLGKCHELGTTQMWSRSSEKETAIYSEASGLCLGVDKEKKGAMIIMTICSSDQAKKWDLIHRKTK